MLQPNVRQLSPCSSPRASAAADTDPLEDDFLSDPLTCELMHDPVLCNDERVYNRDTLLAQGARLHMSPFVPNLPLRICGPVELVRRLAHSRHPQAAQTFTSRRAQLRNLLQQCPTSPTEAAQTRLDTNPFDPEAQLQHAEYLLKNRLYGRAVDAFVSTLLLVPHAPRAEKALLQASLHYIRQCFAGQAPGLAFRCFEQALQHLSARLPLQEGMLSCVYQALYDPGLNHDEERLVVESGRRLATLVCKTAPDNIDALLVLSTLAAQEDDDPAEALALSERAYAAMGADQTHCQRVWHALLATHLLCGTRGENNAASLYHFRAFLELWREVNHRMTPEACTELALVAPILEQLAGGRWEEARKTAQATDHWLCREILPICGRLGMATLSGEG